MRDLKQLVRDGDRMKKGEWIGLGAEWNDIEVRITAIGHAYNDELAKQNRVMARANAGGDVPSAASSAAVVETLISTVLLDVRGPRDVTIDGEPLTMENFVPLIREPGSAELVNAIIMATSRVGRRKASDTEEARGN